jgi:hypothetical protein
MLPKKKNLATELKDLDVDRVDGVDRPATGRAFALYKSAANPVIRKIVGGKVIEDNRATTDRRAVIEKALNLIEQNVADLPGIIKLAKARHVMKAVDGNGRTIGYFVQGSDMQSPLYKTAAEAESLVERIVRGEIAKANRQAADAVKPFVRPEDETNRPDPLSTHLNSGTESSLTDPQNNASPDLAAQVADEDEEWPSGPMTARRAKHRQAMKQARLNKQR